MPENEIEKKEQNTSATVPVSEMRKDELSKGKLQRVGAISPTAAEDELTAAALARQQEQANADKMRNTVSDAYYSPMAQLGQWASERQEAKNKLKLEDETAKRKAQNLQMIAGISDGLASLANLIGVGQGGTNIDMGTGALTPLQQKAEAARLERKADIKSIDDRLEQYKNQLLQMQLAKGSAVAASAEKAADRAFAKEEKAADRAFTKSEREATQQHAESMLDKKLKSEKESFTAKLQNDAFQKALDRSAKIKAATIQADAHKDSKNATGANALKPVKLINEDGTSTDLNLTKGQYDAIMERFEDLVGKDLVRNSEGKVDESTPVGKAYAAYKEAVDDYRAGYTTDTDVEDKRNAVINASPTMRSMLESEAKKSRWSSNKI